MPTDPRGWETDRKRLGDDVVTLAVGDEPQNIIVHKELLCYNSPFFAATLKEDWKEGQEGIVPLRDDGYKTVDLYIQWLYADKIFTRKQPQDSRQGDSIFEPLIDAFVFGDKVQDGNFQDAVIDAIIAATNTPDSENKTWFPGGSTVDDAFERTPEDSQLRRLLVAMHAHNGHSKWSKCANVEFLQELVKEMYEVRPRPYGAGPASMSASSCSYHHHAKDADCYRFRTAMK